MMAFLKSSKTFYLDQITVMFKEQLYSSVLSFGSVALNLGERYPEHVSEAQQVTILIMCGDSAYFTHDYVQAESFYRKALQLGKSLSKGSTSKECVPEDNNDIKYKLYLCLMQCKKPEEALNMLQSIPAKGRAVRTNMALGKLYKQNGMERAAITAFKEVLKECPTSMEAIESLISLGLGDTDLQVFFNHKLNKMPYSEWFHNWIRALQQLFLRDYPSALQTLNTLTDHTPLKHNRYMLHTLSLAYTLEGNYEEAIGPLLLCHRLEPGNMYGMDLLAFLLWSKKKLLTLQSLANRLSDVNYNENRPEAWIALGYYSLLMEPTQKGLSFAERMCAQPLSKEPLNFSKAKSCLDKALQLNKRHWPAVLTLTQILEEEGHYDVAVQKLQEYADGGPTRVRFHLRMAHLLSKMRSNDEAADHYAITLRLDPNNRDALEGLDRLDFRTIMVKEEETEVTSRDIGVSPFNIDDDYQEEPGWVPLNQFAVGERL
ncbi:anaphase-promoting complex subunit 7 isoform X2 [Folsomia candida]|uniref:anaphase-promoting complex subunit 7 isoform X2 n=1 Tax=Folsomia candida TaxID=158441 RepID=UPI0016051695|nr:anaphase-promoting complex subunit 7 isoform X2 [Folsomia candida]